MWGVSLDISETFYEKSLLGRFGGRGAKSPKIAGLQGVFARGFQHDGWSYLDNSGFPASLGVYL